MSLFVDDLEYDFFSRAVDEDEEEEQTLNSVSCIDVEWKELAEQTPCKTLLIGDGLIASKFLDIYEIGDCKCQLVGSVTEYLVGQATAETVESKTIHSQGTVKSFIEQPDLLLITWPQTLDPASLFTCTQQLLSKLVSSQTEVMVLTSAHLTNYRTDQPPETLKPNFVRALGTRHCRSKPHSPDLDQPNIVTGLAAQVLTWCQVHGVAATMYVTYTDSFSVDPQSINSFLSISKSLPIACQTKNHTSVQRSLCQIQTTEDKHRLLYT